MECLNVFSELLGIFGGLIILAYQSCQIFTSPPPPKKKKHHLCIFWYSKVKISHFGSKRSRNHQGCERFGYYILIFLHEGIIQEVKFMTVMYLYNAMVKYSCTILYS